MSKLEGRGRRQPMLSISLQHVSAVGGKFISSSAIHLEEKAVSQAKWLSQNIGTATDAEVDNILNFYRDDYLQGLKASLAEKGINLEQNITIDKVIEGIKQDRGKQAKDTKFVKKFKGELTDIVGEDDKAAGVAEAGFVHMFGLRHRTANAFVFAPGGKLLLQRRVHNKAEAKKLSIFGGHLTAGQSYEEGIKKELLEELSLDEIEEKLGGVLNLIGQEGQFQNDAKDNNEFRSLYIYTLTEEEYSHVNKRKEYVDSEREKRSENEFEKWIEGQQKEKSGYGEVWGYHFVSLNDIDVKDSLNISETEAVTFSSDLLLPLVNGTARLKSGSQQINPMQEIRKKLQSQPQPGQQSSSSLAQSMPEKTGGIDFRALSMSIQPMGSFRGLDFSLSRLSSAELERINIDSQIGQIRDMLRAGISPSGARVKELAAACAQKGQISAYADDLLACIGDILKLEEEIAKESSPELKEALVLADLGGNYFQL